MVKEAKIEAAKDRYSHRGNLAAGGLASLRTRLQAPAITGIPRKLYVCMDVPCRCLTWQSYVWLTTKPTYRWRRRVCAAFRAALRRAVEPRLLALRACLEIAGREAEGELSLRKAREVARDRVLEAPRLPLLPFAKSRCA